MICALFFYKYDYFMFCNSSVQSVFSYFLINDVSIHTIFYSFIIRYNFLNDLPSLDPELYRHLRFLKVWSHSTLLSKALKGREVGKINSFLNFRCN
jgi:hypothetical protein